jgi:hypothetical protein
MPFDLLSFLKNAKLGPICLGMTRAQIEEVLGKPDFESGVSQAFGNTFIQYASWQFHFAPKATPDGQLTKVYVDDISRPLANLGANVKIWCWELAWGSRMTLVKESLKREHISFIEEDEKRLNMSSGVRLIFTRNDNDTATVLSAIALS